MSSVEKGSYKDKNGTEITVLGIGMDVDISKKTFKFKDKSFVVYNTIKELKPEGFDYFLMSQHNFKLIFTKI